MPDKVMDTAPKLDLDLPVTADGSSFQTYRAMSAAQCLIELDEGQSPSDFWFKAKVFQLPEGVLFKASASAHNMTRDLRTASLERDTLMVSTLTEGTSDGRFGDREVAVGPGDVFILDNAYTYETKTSPFTMLSLYVKRTRINGGLLGPRSHGAVLKAGSGGALLLGSALDRLIAVAEELPLSVTDSAVDGFCHLAAALFRPRFESGHPTGERSILPRAISFIEANLYNADLGPSRLETELGISRSGLYRLFEDFGGVGGVILRMRLEKSFKSLLETDTRPNWRTISPRFGFRSEAHFTRAFRTRYGITPRIFHDLVRRRDVAALRKLAQTAGFENLDSWINQNA